jgi:hypothetical protein
VAGWVEFPVLTDGRLSSLLAYLMGGHLVRLLMVVFGHCSACLVASKKLSLISYLPERRQIAGRTGEEG